MSTIPHTEWIAEIVSKPMFTTVGDPVTTGMFKKTTTYGVSSGSTEACSGNTVRRRYSDFEWLYLLLCNRYQGMVVPTIPPKGGMIDGGDAFLQKRAIGLDRFLKRCSENPFLKADPSYQHFLSYETGSKWDTLKKTATSQCHQNFLTRPVIDQYRAYGMELASGDGAGDDESDEKIIAAYTRLAKTAAAAVKYVDSSVASFGQAGANSDKATLDLHGKLSTIAEITSSAQGESDIMSALSEFQAIIGATSSSLESFTTHQTFGYGVADAHLSPATNEIASCFQEITGTMLRLKSLRTSLKNAEKSKRTCQLPLYSYLFFYYILLS
jgi:hypothetical protein